MNNYAISFEDFFLAQKINTGWKKWIVPVMSLALGLFKIIKSILVYGGEDLFTSVVFAVILLVIALVLFPLIQQKQFKKLYESHSVLHETITGSFDHEGIKLSSDSGNSNLKWKDILKYKKNDSMVLIYEAKNLYRPIPVRAFTSADEHKKFIKYLVE